MTEERNGFTIKVHGDVPQEALDELVAAIPTRTVIVGAGPHAHAKPDPMADDVNQTFGTGSEAATMVHAVLRPKPHETWQEREARRDQEDFDKATKIDAKDYTGWVVWPGHGDNDGYFKSVAAVIAYCADHEINGPTFVWACTSEHLHIDAESILEDALEEHFDDAGDSITKLERARLQTFLNEWTAAQRITSWHEDRTRAVMLPPGDEQ